jgi:hypothetical protein
MKKEKKVFHTFWANSGRLKNVFNSREKAFGKVFKNFLKDQSNAHAFFALLQSSVK